MHWKSLCSSYGGCRHLDGLRNLQHQARGLQSLFAWRRCLPNGATTFQSPRALAWSSAAVSDPSPVRSSLSAMLRPAPRFVVVSVSPLIPRWLRNRCAATSDVQGHKETWQNEASQAGGSIPAYAPQGAFFLRYSMAWTSTATASITSTTGSTLNSKAAKTLVTK
jgi:hypothetical protein